MVHRHHRDPDSLDVLQDCQTDVAPVYQTVSCVTWDEWDNDSLTEAADADDPNMDDFYQRVVSSDDEDLFESDDGSVTDIDRDMSEEEYYLDSDLGSVADNDGIMSDEDDCCVLDDMDMLEDFVGSDVWSVTDLDSSMTDVDEEDSWIVIRIWGPWRILIRTHMMDACVYCALIARRIFMIYEVGLWMVSGWFISDPISML